MNRFIIFCALTAMTISGQAQVLNFEWAGNLENNFITVCRDVAIDQDENVISVGSFHNTQDFDPGPGISNMTTSWEDIFIRKLDASGNFVWAKQIGGPSICWALAVTCDTLNNIFVFGFIDDLADFDPGPGTLTLGPSPGKAAYISKYDSDGNLLWAHMLPGLTDSSPSERKKIVCSADGGIIIPARFTGTYDFDPGPGIHNISSIGSLNSYVLKLDSDGNFVWVSVFTGASQTCNAVSVTSTGDIYVTGQFSFTVDFDPGPGVENMTSGTYWDAYIVKLDNTGNLIWAKAVGDNDEEEGVDLAIGASENVMVIGEFTGSGDFDPGVGIHTLTSNGDKDIFLVNLNANGDFQWAHSFGGSLDDNGMHVSVDSSGNFYCTGSFYGTIDMQPGAGTFNLEAPTTFDIFLCKYSSIGDILWAESIEGSTNFDKAHSIVPSENGNIYLVGDYDGNVDFNPGPGLALYSSGLGNDAFCIKFSQCYPAPPIPVVVNLPDTTTQCAITSLTAPQATESCYGTINGIPDISFPITAQGTTVITWTYDVGGANITTQTQNVIIEDTTAPVPNQSSLPDVSTECQLTNLIAPTATDNCGGTISGTHSAILPITTIGTTIITWTYDDGNGNSITQTQNVVITEIDNSVNLIDALTLSANATGYAYQWLDCTNGNTPISGETGQTFIATTNGSYAVQISDGTCTVTSTCYLISEVGISESKFVSVLIYPNPSNGTFKILPNAKHLSIEIYDERGCLIDGVDSLSDEHTITVDASGTYFVHVFQNGEQVGIYPIVVAL